MPEALPQCPVCRLTEARVRIEQWAVTYRVTCPNCGHSEMAESTIEWLRDQKALSQEGRGSLGHFVWRMQGSQAFFVRDDLVEEHAQNPQIPEPSEQLSNLLVYMGDKLKHSGNALPWKDVSTLYAKTGVTNWNGLTFLVRSLAKAGLLEVYDKRKEASVSVSSVLQRHGDTGEVYLIPTIEGWQHYGELKRQRTDTKRAFMAMPFPRTEGPDWEYTQKVKAAYMRFQEAVVLAGFHLENPLLDVPKSGLIPERLMVEIRNAKFLVADLTTQNLGVYWEAGAAHGLGKKVIYTCHEDHVEGIHFDAKQMQVISWKEDAPDVPCETLKAIIRNDFPTEAIMADEDAQ